MPNKRASPGAETEKNPLQDVELAPEDVKKLEELSDVQTRVEIAIERENLAKLNAVYEKRRPVLKSINNFWPIALLKHHTLPVFIEHNADQIALSYLEDVWIERDQKDHRCFTLEMYFKENPFFHDKVLKKSYVYKPAQAADETLDPNGVSEAMVKFSWDTDVEPMAMKINWKDADKALTKVYPRVDTDDEEEDPFDLGSFFNFFETGPDPFEHEDIFDSDDDEDSDPDEDDDAKEN